MMSFHTDQKIAYIDWAKNNWHQNYNDFNLSQNPYFSTDLKANWKAWRGNSGGSNNSNRIKIDPQKRVASDEFISYWPKDSIDWAKKIGIKITTISTCRKIVISQ